VGRIFTGGDARFAAARVIYRFGCFFAGAQVPAAGDFGYHLQDRRRPVGRWSVGKLFRKMLL
jgi:hypothetical protein